MTFLVVAFVFLTSPIQVMSAQAPSTQKPSSLQRLWDPNYREPFGKTAALAIPRLGQKVGSWVTESSLVKRVKNTVISPFELPFHLERGAQDAANGFLNPGASLNSAVSDVLGPTPDLLRLGSRQFSRVKVCSQNFSEALNGDIDEASLMSFVLPIFHVGIVVDGIEEYGDYHSLLASLNTYQELACRTVQIKKGGSPLIALEKLKCFEKQFRYTYSFGAYNCGGVAHTILRESNLTDPSFPNLGIGDELPVPHFSRREARASARKASESCDRYLNLFWEIISQMERGKEVPDSSLKELLVQAKKGAFGWDASLQFLISSTHVVSLTPTWSALVDRAVLNVDYAVQKIREAETRYPRPALRFWRKTLAKISEREMQFLRAHLKRETIQTLMTK